MPISSLKHAVCICLVLFAINHSYAQSKVYGQVLDMKGKPVLNANVLLLKSKDSSLVKGYLTEKTGGYSFDNIEPGSYLVASSFSGLKQSFTRSFDVTNEKELKVEELILSEKEVELAEVSVIAKKPLFEQKIDRMVINVATSITNAGNSALDVLMKSPGIIVDQQNNTLSMNGKDGVVIMLNGKLSRMPISAMVQLLAGMSVNNIEKIELITTPPANFDAEGNAGFINIVTKTSLQYGTNGSYSLTAGYGKKPVGAASFNFNYRKQKWNLFGDYAFAETRLWQFMEFYRKVMNSSTATESFMNTDRDALRRTHDGRIGVDYEWTKKTTVGVLLSGFSNLYSMDALNTSKIYLNQQLDTTIKINNTEEHPLHNYSANLNFLHQFSADQRLTLNLDYIYYKDANDVDYNNNFYKGNGSFLYKEMTRSYKATPIRFWVASLDYAKKISKKTDMEAGAKTTISRFENDVRVERSNNTNSWIVDESLTANYNLKESINAGYVNFNIKLGEKTGVKAGLRYEYTMSNLSSGAVKNIVDRKYGNWFPSLFISHALDDNNSLNVSYSRRITRPTFNDMAPFVYFVDPNTYFSGNPALQPSISNAVKADYLYKSFIFSLSYTYESDPITNFAPSIDPVSNKQTLAAENQKNKNIVSLTVSLPVKVASWWSMQNNLSGLWQQLNAYYKSEPLRIAQENFSLNSTQTFMLPKEYSIELRGFYQSGGLFGIYQMKAFGSADLGVQKKLKDKKSNLRFSVSDVFGPPKFRASVNLPEKNLITSGNLQFSNTTFRLTFNHNFGNDKVKGQRTRATGSEEERQRVTTN